MEEYIVEIKNIKEKKEIIEKELEDRKKEKNEIINILTT